jgi:hypothetical protein
MIANPNNTAGQTAATWNGLDNGLQAALLANSVVLRSRDNRFTASGILFYAAAYTAAAYVLTAKHNLYVQNPPETSYTDYTPASFTAGFIQNVQVGYGPAALGQAPATLVAINAITFPGGSDQDWTYDTMLLEVTDADFITYVKANALMKVQSDAQTVLNQIKAQANFVRPALVKTKWKYIQTGYGGGKDDDVQITQNWPDHTGSFQCRFPEPTAQQTETAYNLDLGDKTSWATCPPLSDVIMLSASNYDSTGPGDSGGGLFALSPQASPTSAIPVGVSYGINLSLARQAGGLTDTKISNSASTCIEAALKICVGDMPIGP